MAGWHKATVALLALSLGAFSEVTMATEEVPYTVERTLESGVEIRRYGDTVIAQTVIESGTYGDAGNEGFRRLAGYIFGANHRSDRIAMTAPVGQKIEMTAPVSQQAGGDQGWVVRFYMPTGWTLQSLPTPDDERVALVDLPPETVAVVRFSGDRGTRSIAEHTRRLRATLRAYGFLTIGEPTAWFYDPPWTLPFLRRNEVAVSIEA